MKTVLGLATSGAGLQEQEQHLYKPTFKPLWGNQVKQMFLAVSLSIDLCIAVFRRGDGKL